MLQHPEVAASLKERLVAVSRAETNVMMDRLLDKARQEQEWGVPAILDACLALANADPSQGGRLGGFLGNRPPAQIRPNIIPKIGEQPWAAGVFTVWERSEVSKPVKVAIKRRRDNGNVAV